MPVLNEIANIDSTLIIEANASLNIMEKGVIFPDDIHNYGTLDNYGNIGRFF